MRTEISQAKREANFYLENVDKNKAFRAMEKRRKNKNSKEINTKVGEFTIITSICNGFFVLNMHHVI